MSVRAKHCSLASGSLVLFLVVCLWGYGARSLCAAGPARSGKVVTRDVIVGHVSSSETIAVAEPAGEAACGDLGHRLSAIVGADLERSGAFSLVDYDGPVLERPDMASGLVVPRKASFLLTYRIERTSRGFETTAWLFEAGRGPARWARRYPFPGDRLKEAAHRLSDDVHKEVTGRDGFASSTIAFVADHDGHSAIYTVSPSGGRPRLLVSGNFSCLFPRFAPTRNWLVYTAYRRGFPELFLLDVNSGMNHRVSGRPGLNSFGALSPGGLELAATLSWEGNPELYLLSVTGSLKRRLTRDRACDLSPTWSPGGERLAYVNDSTGSPQIFVLSVAEEGASPVRITWPFSSSAYCVEPSWSPDGRYIAFSARVDGSFDIFVTDPAGREVRALTRGKPDESSPDWAPDDRHLVVAVRGGNGTGLEIIDSWRPSVRMEVRLSENLKNVRSPTWQRVSY